VDQFRPKSHKIDILLDNALARIDEPVSAEKRHNIAKGNNDNFKIGIVQKLAEKGGQKYYG
jgi:hypothetical protein